jgi:hypothetical protein
MHTCHDPSLILDLSKTIGFDGNWVFVISIILTGVLGSFTHCIGMCGPIAMMQSSMRLMNVKSNQMQQYKKVHASLALPYYFGKATTYVFYYLLLEMLTYSFKTSQYYNFFISALMILSGCAFAWLAISKNFSFFTSSLSSNKKSSIERLISRLKLKPFGLSGFIMGFILGLVPCGFVYAVVLAVASYVESIALGALTVFIFGLSTVPGLFLVSYFGNYILERLKGVFVLMLRILAAFNALLLFRFAYSLLFMH